MTTMSAVAMLGANFVDDHVVADQVVFAPARARNFRRPFRSVSLRVLRKLRGEFEHKPSYELAEILQCDVRSAQRYFAGDRIPSGDIVFAMLTDPRIGPSVLRHIADEAHRRLSTEDFETFKSEMAKAALRAFLRD